MSNPTIHLIFTHLLKTRTVSLLTGPRKLFTTKSFLKPKIKPCYLIPNRSFMLETTKVKINQSYEYAVRYIKTLTAERVKLMELTSNEAEMNKLENKQEVFQRLDKLLKVSDIYESVVKATADFRELSEMMETSGDDETDEFKKMLADDIERLNEELLELKTQMVQCLIPEEAEDKENATIELSAGVGGAESGLFCSELYATYEAYANYMGWSFVPVRVDTEKMALTEMMRKAVFEVYGQNVFKYLKFESGVHRVQRVPKTESKGRIHTSTVGVVVSPKPEQINIELNPKDLKIETKTSGGPGGQHANKTESAVRLTHLPTGIVVYCDAERHMMQNRQQAMDNLVAKLYQNAFEEQLNKRQNNRKMQIGSSSRSSRIRTYNFLQDRITDHRLGENFVGVSRFMAGDHVIHKVLENLILEQQTEILYETLDNFNKNVSK